MTFKKNDYHIYHLYSDKKNFIDIKVYKKLIFINDISNENNTQQTLILTISILFVTLQWTA